MASQKDGDQLEPGERADGGPPSKRQRVDVAKSRRSGTASSRPSKFKLPATRVSAGQSIFRFMGSQPASQGVQPSSPRRQLEADSAPSGGGIEKTPASKDPEQPALDDQTTNTSVEMANVCQVVDTTGEPTSSSALQVACELVEEEAIEEAPSALQAVQADVSECVQEDGANKALSESRSSVEVGKEDISECVQEVGANEAPPASRSSVEVAEEDVAECVRDVGEDEAPVGEQKSDQASDERGREVIVSIAGGSLDCLSDSSGEGGNANSDSDAAETLRGSLPAVDQVELFNELHGDDSANEKPGISEKDSQHTKIGSEVGELAASNLIFEFRM